MRASWLTHRVLPPSDQDPYRRKELPAFAFRDRLIGQLSEGQVTVISGATGCGKTTQVPQYILEDAHARGGATTVNVICTQPRRISAVGVAQRVAAERGEGVGETVGYMVRLDRKVGPRTRLLYCTVGILLRRLQDDSTLQGVTHIVVDECRECAVHRPRESRLPS